MKTLNASELLAALGHESRLAIFRLLVEAGPDGLNASLIGERVGLAATTLSFHLAHLSRVGLIQGRRESRFIHYSAAYEVMDELFAFLTNNCCQGQACLPRTAAAAQQTEHASEPYGGSMSDRAFNVLFLCTGNSARSILAEAILNQIGKGRFKAYSAGSHPANEINPHVRAVLDEQRFPTSELRSKSWDEFSLPEAPAMDFVFTVCDKAAGEPCPVWPGHPLTAHWGVDDPVRAGGDNDAMRFAVLHAMQILHRRISLLVSLPLDKIGALALQREIDDIGRTS